MGSEREHKWLVRAFPDATRLEEAFAKEDVAVRYAAERDQHDTYFDTLERRLQGAGAALRIRRLRDETLATYKGSGAVVGTLHTREEIEVPFTKPWPEAVGAKLTTLGVAEEQLEPLVDLYTTRTRYLLYNPDDPAPLAELSFDEVKATHGGRTVQFKELELEAQPDTPDADLAELAEVLSRFGLTPHAGDKLTHALTLLSL